MRLLPRGVNRSPVVRSKSSPTAPFKRTPIRCSGDAAVDGAALGPDEAGVAALGAGRGLQAARARRAGAPVTCGRRWALLLGIPPHPVGAAGCGRGRAPDRR